MQIRLINTTTLQLSDFYELRDDGEAGLEYAVLSHRWGPDHEEISYKDYSKCRNLTGAGHQKVAAFCKFAASRGLRWAWVDTCCIDKRSSAELSEAINSMWAIYAAARECIVYLQDLRVQDVESETGKQALTDCVWFRRGWTLQELLAPDFVLFCNADWNILGQITRRPRSSSPVGNVLRPLPLGPLIHSTISAITNIGTEYMQLNGKRIRDASVAERMSWAARRRTTRLEDEAYCLLGIFDINMPLLYGEGRKAFRRLQEEIIKTSDDTSLFAWDDAGDQSPPEHFHHGVLARSASDFAHSKYVARGRLKGGEPYTVTHKGLQMTARARVRLLAYSWFVDSPKILVKGFEIDLGCSHVRRGEDPVRLSLFIAGKDDRDSYAPTLRVSKRVMESIDIHDHETELTERPEVVKVFITL